MRTSAIIATLIILSLATSGCCGGFLVENWRPPEGPCPLEHLLIHRSDLPNDRWYEGGINEPPARVRADKLGISFYTTEKGGVGQHVYWFWGLSDAKDEYRGSVRGWYAQREDETEWITPEDLKELPISADEYELRCSKSTLTGAEKCRYFARYGRHLIELHVTILAISHEQLIGLIAKIDMSVNACQAR
jgi:hypothetical protein